MNLATSDAASGLAALAVSLPLIIGGIAILAFAVIAFLLPIFVFLLWRNSKTLIFTTQAIQRELATIRALAHNQGVAVIVKEPHGPKIDLWPEPEPEPAPIDPATEARWTEPTEADYVDPRA